MPEVIEYIKSSAKGVLVGYENWEITKIEKLYDIKIDRSLKDFLLTMGRCSGGPIGDGSIILYRNSFSIRTHISIGFWLIDDLQNLGYFDLVGLKPFVFAIEGETYYMFLATEEEGEQFVYCFDENENKVEKTRETFSSYIYREAKLTVECYNQNTICNGDLLKI